LGVKDYISDSSDIPVKAEFVNPGEEYRYSLADDWIVKIILD